MSQSNTSKKLYLDVVEKLRSIIEEDKLIHGDKIPSERELSERLKVGRSSIREALRALEILGLIETRRGEGTFIKDFQDHKLVELLGTFFLQNSKVQQDLEQTKRFIETDCLRVVLSSTPTEELQGFLTWAETNEFDDDLFFKKIAELNANRLLERIWSIVNVYAKVAMANVEPVERSNYLTLIHALIDRNEELVHHLYLDIIRKISNAK